MKLRRAVEQLRHDIAMREVLQKIAGQTSEASGVPGEMLIRKHVENVQREPGAADVEAQEGLDLRRRFAQLPLPEEPRKEVDRELERLERTPSASPEHGMIQTYLDWMLKLPWEKKTGADIDCGHARQVLDEDHHDLAPVKERIVDYLAVRRLRMERGVDTIPEDAATREPILCFVGPPGVGKTSLAQSIARALSRKLARVALGGIYDEAEIRGHRRTYIGAMPGRILQALVRAGASDPVFMLDEVDKVGVGFHGDPQRRVAGSARPGSKSRLRRQLPRRPLRLVGRSLRLHGEHPGHHCRTAARPHGAHLHERLHGQRRSSSSPVDISSPRPSPRTVCGPMKSRSTMRR